MELCFSELNYLLILNQNIIVSKTKISYIVKMLMLNI